MNFIKLVGTAVVAGALGALVPVAEATAAAPVIFVYPNPATSGQQAVVYGTNFCNASGCSAVTIKIDDGAVANGVAVKPDGTFSAGFKVTQMFGQHTVTATQIAADGSSISAIGGFRVAAGDPTTPSPTSGNPPPSAAPPSGGTVKPTPSGGGGVTTSPSTSPKAPATAPVTPASASPAPSGTQGEVPVALGVAGLLALLALVSLVGLYVARRRSAEK